MEAKNADLSALRINRAAEAAATPGGSRRWVTLAVVVGSVGAAVALLFVARGALGSGVEVQLARATLLAPGQADAVLVASGYVVAQRKAAVASKGTGRIVYLGVAEGDRVRAGQVIARLEDSDVRARGGARRTTEHRERTAVVLSLAAPPAPTVFPPSPHAPAVATVTVDPPPAAM